MQCNWTSDGTGGGHRGEYDYTCQTCGKTDWFARYDLPEAGYTPPNCPNKEAPMLNTPAIPEAGYTPPNCPNKEAPMLNTPAIPTQPVTPNGVLHNVKSWTHFFQAIRRGDKLHDMRDLKDRDYKVGDILNLQEYDPFMGRYTGEECRVLVTYITSAQTPCAFSSAALAPGFAILSLRLVA